MQTFLNKCIEYILAKHGFEGLQHLQIILPSRRGVAQFRVELLAKIDKAIFAPKIYSIEDFMVQLSQKKIASSIDQLYTLYNAAKSLDSGVKFDFFLSWAPTLLKDFELIDQYLVDARQIFNYVAEAQRIQEWDVEKDQTKTEQPTVFKNNNFLDIYTRFGHLLSNKNLAYRGAAYRAVHQNIAQILADIEPYTYFYFLGFNALSGVEEELIKALQQAQKATCLWDTDSFYMSEADSGQLAGRFLKKYKFDATFGKTWHWEEQLLLNAAKTINYSTHQSATNQALYCQYILTQWWAQPEKAVSTALVLADESMLEIVLSHIPKCVGNYNVTMGLTFQKTEFYQVINIIFKIQEYVKVDKNNTVYFNTKLIINFLNLNLVKVWLKTKSIDINVALKSIKKIDVSYLHQKQLIEIFESPSMATIFTAWNGNKDLMFQTLNTIQTELSETTDQEIYTIEYQYIKYFEEVLLAAKRLDVLDSEPLHTNQYKSLIFEICKQYKLPFDSARSAKLQIMGMLETRTLDFERIIILSANENILPANNKNKTLLPFDALVAFGLPTYSQQDAIMSYHFFRLLQRANEVEVAFMAPKAIYGANEPSRFIFQIQNLLAPKNSNISLKEVHFTPDIRANNESDLIDFEVSKTEEILDKILDIIENKGLSATNINEWISCNMKFYLKRILKLDEDKELTEHLGPDKFGTLIHEVLEYADTEVLPKKSNVSDYEKFKALIPDILKQTFSKLYPNQTSDTGLNYALLEVAQILLTNYIDYKITHEVFPIENIANETELKYNLKIELPNKTVNAQIKGVLDKIEISNNQLKIVDFKTGRVEQKQLLFKDKLTAEEELEKIQFDEDAGYLRQLWLYQFLLQKNTNKAGQIVLENKLVPTQGYDMVAGIYSFRNLQEGLLRGISNFKIGPNFLDISEQILTNFVKDMLDTDQKISNTADIKNCKYCNFTDICKRTDA